MRERREELGLTQKDLVRRSSLKISTIGELERGTVRENRREDTLSKISVGLDMPAGWLDAVADDREPPEQTSADSDCDDHLSTISQRLERVEDTLAGLRKDISRVKELGERSGKAVDSIEDALARLIDQTAPADDKAGKSRKTKRQRSAYHRDPSDETSSARRAQA